MQINFYRWDECSAVRQLMDGYSVMLFFLRLVTFFNDYATDFLGYLTIFDNAAVQHFESACWNCRNVSYKGLSSAAPSSRRYAEASLRTVWLGIETTGCTHEKKDSCFPAYAHPAARCAGGSVLRDVRRRRLGRAECLARAWRRDGWGFLVDRGGIHFRGGEYCQFVIAGCMVECRQHQLVVLYQRPVRRLWQR